MIRLLPKKWFAGSSVIWGNAFSFVSCVPKHAIAQVVELIVPQMFIWHRHLEIDEQCFKDKLDSIPSIEPRPNDWESSTKPLLRTQVCLYIYLSILVPFLQRNASIWPLKRFWQTTLILCCQNPFRGQMETFLCQERNRDGRINIKTNFGPE